LFTEKLYKLIPLIVLIVLALYLLYSGFITVNKSETYVSDEIYYVTAAKNIGIRIFNINVTKIPYPEYKGIDFSENLNLEHPPLAKYLMFFSMLIFGDNPFAWRIPGVILHILTMISIYYAVKKLANEASAIVAVFIVAFDPILKNLGYIAMLDIYVAFFLAASFTALVYRKSLLAYAIFGLALASKYTALFALPAFLLITYFEERKLRRLPMYIIVTALTYVAVWAPFIKYFSMKEGSIYGGLLRVYEEHLSAMRWHLSSKGGHSYSSPPWGWLFNYKVWPIYGGLSVHSNIYINTVFIILPLIYALFGRDVETRRYYPYFWFISSFIGFMTIYMLGSTTQFIFYSSTYEPAIAAGIGALLIPSLDSLIEKIEERLHRGRRGHSQMNVNHYVILGLSQLFLMKLLKLKSSIAF